MASPTQEPEPEIILYDLACNKNVCFSPVVWRIRLMLNYKRVPYKTVFLEFPDIERVLGGLGIPPNNSTGIKYTVPTIHHIPTKRYMMDSTRITPFLESTYPSPPLLPANKDIEAKSRVLVGPLFRTSLMPREIAILSPRSAAYFRQTREAALGGRVLEDLLVGEEEAWEAAEEGLRAASALMLGDGEGEGGPFVLGAKEPSLTDFTIAGALRSARVIGGGVWERCMAFEGYKRVYEGCEVWMGKED